jgi:arylsulfatase A-like enzyme
VKRTSFLLILAAIVAAIAAGLFFLGKQTPVRPNIVVIVIDTLRADHLPIYGYPHPTAPFLGRLEQESIVFDRVYSTSSWTSPATASLFTSLYPTQHGVTTGMVATRRAQRLDPTVTLNAIPEEAVTLPEMMQRAGYRTFGVADNWNISADEGFDQGFDAFQSYNDRGADAVNAQVDRWRAEILEQGSPYFLYLQYMDPHRPYRLQERWSGELGATGSPDVSAYDSEIRLVDEHIRELFEGFGWSRDTILVVSADHGEEFGDHGEYDHGHNLYNETLRVPLLIHPASILGAKSGRCSEPVSLIDLYPTLREIVGERSAGHEEGRSLLSTLRSGGTSPGEDRRLFAHLQRSALEYKDGERIVRAAISGGHKYLVRFPEAREELYDVIRDSGETRDLSAAEAGRAAELRQALEAFEETSPRLPGVSREILLDEAEIEKLRSLGYAE